VTGLAILVSLATSFVYFSISVGFPIVSYDDNPAISTYFKIDDNQQITSYIKVSGIAAKYRYGSHIGLNPVYILAWKLFSTQADYTLCIKGVDEEFKFVSRPTNHWFEVHGWQAIMSDDDATKLLQKHLVDRVNADVILVKGKCAKQFEDNSPVLRYSVEYRLPHLVSLQHAVVLTGMSHRQALAELQKRIKLDAGQTQLHTAIRRNCLDCVKSKIEHGANPAGAQDTKQVPLRYAFHKKNLEMFKYLAQQGATDDLIYYANSKYYPYLKVLVDHGETVNEKDASGKTALGEAIRSSCMECVKLLVSNGANVNTYYQRLLPLYMALKSTDMTRYLLLHGANPSLPYAHDIKTSVHEHVMRSSPERYKNVKALILQSIN